MPTLPDRQRGLAIPYGLLGMLLLLLVVEGHVAHHTLDYTRSDFWDWRQTARFAERNTQGCQVLCFGTSRIQQALVPQVIEGRSGLKAWNLGVCWGQAPAAYFLLKRVLDAGAKPSAILVEYHPAALSADPWTAQGFWPELLNWREALDLWWSSRDSTLFGSTMLAHSLPTVKDRSQIGAMIRGALVGKNATMWASTLTSVRNRNVNRGAMLMPGDSGFEGKIGAQYQEAFFDTGWAATKLNESYIRRFLQLAAAKSIQVYWVLPPFAPKLQEKREQTENTARFTAFVRRWMAEFPRLVVLDAEHSGFAPNLFYDGSHLDREGAMALSALVGDQLKSTTSDPGDERWVRLPQYRETPLAAVGEDMVMTRDHLLKIGKIRR